MTGSLRDERGVRSRDSRRAGGGGGASGESSLVSMAVLPALAFDWPMAEPGVPRACARARAPLPRS